jgi:5'-nucleotidase
LLILVNKISAGIRKRNANVDTEWFPLNIIHLNDFHARFEETGVDSGSCKSGQKCVGGYARVVTMVKKLKEENQHLNPIYLNAGDNFQGTLWYNIFRWNVTQYFLNLLPADAMTIGNHEFDHGIAGVVPFLEAIKSPIIITNVNDSLVEQFQEKYTNSTIIERNGRKIGIIGVILQTTDIIAQTGDLKFTRESEAVKEEAKKLKRNGINIIIVLSHCGLEVDKKIAQYGGTDISIIVGGHSHSFLFTGPNPPGTDQPKDNYPIVFTQKSNHRVLIVQASAFTKYLGNITLFYDDEGKVQHFEGAPIYLDSDVPQDPTILEEIKPWKIQVDAFGHKEMGRTDIELTNNGCYYQECSLGNFVTDAYANVVSYIYLITRSYSIPKLSVCRAIQWF